MKIGDHHIKSQRVTKIPNRIKFYDYQTRTGDIHLKWMNIIGFQANKFTPSIFSWKLNALIKLTECRTKDYQGDWAGLRSKLWAYLLLF